MKVLKIKIETFSKNDSKYLWVKYIPKFRRSKAIRSELSDLTNQIFKNKPIAIASNHPFFKINLDTPLKFKQFVIIYENFISSLYKRSHIFQKES